MAVVLKIRKGTTLQWSSSNKVLQVGELGIDTTLNKIKAGNGSSLWAALPWLTTNSDEVGIQISGILQDANDYTDTAITSLGNTVDGAYVPVSDIGNADGVASLDENGKIPDSEIPDSIARDSEIPSLSGYATETYVTTAISNLVDTAPETLNTLNELAAALGDDPNYATTLTNALATKASLTGIERLANKTLESTTIDTSEYYMSFGNESITFTSATTGSFNVGIPSSANRLLITGSDSSNGTYNVTVGQFGEFTLSVPVVLNGSGIVAGSPTYLFYTQGSTISSAEIGYLDGVTSSIQTQLNLKLNSSGFTYASITIPVYSTIGDLPAASDNHGRWAHVHGEGSMYYAHGGAWYRTLSQDDLYISTNAQSSSYTLNSSDLGKMIEMSNGGTLTITDSASFPVGFSADILQTGSSQVTIAGNGFTPNATPGLKLRSQWSSATIVKRALNSWVVFGDLSA